MPSKKPNKAAKRPGKATTIKKTTPKEAVPTKKTAKPPAKLTPIATSKVKVKQHQTEPQNHGRKALARCTSTAKAAVAKAAAVESSSAVKSRP